MSKINKLYLSMFQRNIEKFIGEDWESERKSRNES